MPQSEHKSSLFSQKDAVFFILFLTLFLAVFRDFFFTDKVFYERDMTVIEIPARKLYVDLMKEGNWALWTDAYGNGQPFLANPKNAVFYPTSLLYLILPFFSAFKLHYLIHVVFLWLGLYRLCRSFSLSREASFLGSSVFVFSGMYLSSFEFYNHIAALAWMPWILLLVKGNLPHKFPRIVLAASFWALMILAGAPEIVLISMALAFGLAFSGPQEWKKRVVTVACSFILACLFTAVQLIPSIELLGRTEKRAVSANWPLELIQLFNIPFPHFLGNDREPGHHDYWGWHLFDKKFPLYYSLYMGVAVILLAFYALRRPMDRRRLIFLLLFSAFFLVSCGRYSPFFFLYRYIPFLSSLRYPVKLFMGSVFCLSILAAFGADDLVLRRNHGRRIAGSCMVISAIISALYWPFKIHILGALNQLFIIDELTLLRELGRSIETGILLLAVFSLVFFAVEKKRAKTRLLALGFIALAVLDPALHNRFVNPTVPTSFFERPALAAEFSSPQIIYREAVIPPFFKETVADDVRLLGYFHESLYPFTGIGDGVRYVFNDDFYGTYPANFKSKMDAVKSLPAKEQYQILTALGCAAYIGIGSPFSRERARPISIQGQTIWVDPITEERPAPHLAFSVEQAEKIEGRLQGLIRKISESRNMAVLENDLCLGEAPRNPAASTITVKNEVQGKGDYSVHSAQKAIAVFPGNHAPGWQAWIDGKKIKIFEADLFSRGVLVPAGNHEIVLRYLPKSFIWGFAVSLSSIIAVMILLSKLGIRSKERLSGDKKTGRRS